MGGRLAVGGADVVVDFVLVIVLLILIDRFDHEYGYELPDLRFLRILREKTGS